MIEQTACPVCQSNLTTAFLFRGQVPIHQNLVVKDFQSACSKPRGNLDLTVCEECGFIFNRAFTAKQIMYGEDYDNTQSHSPSFEEYLDSLVRHMVLEQGVQNCQIVEVGCGKGLFLRKLVEFNGANNTGYGFDPSYVGEEILLDGRLRFERRYYDSDCADVPADVIVCRHVIEHVPAPLDLLRNLKKALINSPRARVFFETPCVEWILSNQVVWDFFYEHCSYFTVQSLTTAFQLAGFEVEHVQHIFGGQYLWLEATASLSHEPRVTKTTHSIPALAQAFARKENELKELWGSRVKQLATREIIALWGAGAKGVTFANLIDPDRRWIDCVIDLNPEKQGHFIPGTGHPIVSYRELARRGVTTAILMNPNYQDECLGLLQESGQNVRLLCEGNQFVANPALGLSYAN